MFSIAIIVLICINNNKNVKVETAKGYYGDMYQLLLKFSDTWDMYLQIDEIEKQIIWRELDSLRLELNLQVREPDVMLGLKQYKQKQTYFEILKQ